MKVYSASQAVWPAIQRTTRFLFCPFAWETFLKLASVAVITEGVVVNVKLWAPNAPFPDASPIGRTSFLQTPGFILIAVLAGLAAIVIGLLLYLMVTQLRFAFFHCLIHQAREIRPAWSLYRVQAQRMFVASLSIWLTLLVPAILVVVGLVVLAFTVMTLRTPDGLLDPGVFLMLFFPGMGLALLLCLLGVAAEVVMHDFILPHMALENRSFREAWTAVWQCIGANKETFFSYFILRLLLPGLAGVILAIVCLILLLIVFGILGMSAAGFNAMLEDATGIGALVRVAIEVLFALLGLGIGYSVAVGLGGPVATWIRNYALLFYGGRYKALGDLLYPPAPSPPSPIASGAAEIA
jgi:hypothetical protein